MSINHLERKSDSEIADWLALLVSDQRPEDLYIDYKFTVYFDKREDKLELAKDLSAFANTEGGVLLVGFDEEMESGSKTGVPKTDYGIDKINEFETRVRQILEDAVTPQLPHTIVREILVTNNPAKFVYLIYHPKSWGRPHMTGGYKEKRYYKRDGNKNRPLEAHEVEDLFQEKFRTTLTVDKYLKTLQDGSELIQKPRGPLTFKALILPIPVHEGMIDLYSTAGRVFWYGQTFMSGSGGHPDWRPCRDGVVLHSYMTSLQESDYIVKLHPTGAVSYSLQDLNGTFGFGTGKLLIPTLLGMAFSKHLREFLLGHLERLNHKGDLLLRISTKDLNIPLSDGLDSNAFGPVNSYPEYIGLSDIEVEVITNTIQLKDDMSAVIDLLLDAIGRQIGIWDYASRLIRATPSAKAELSDLY